MRRSLHGLAIAALLLLAAAATGCLCTMREAWRLPPGEPPEAGEEVPYEPPELEPGGPRPQKLPAPAEDEPGSGR